MYCFYLSIRSFIHSSLLPFFFFPIVSPPPQALVSYGSTATRIAAAVGAALGPHSVCIHWQHGMDVKTVVGRVQRDMGKRGVPKHAKVRTEEEEKN